MMQTREQRLEGLGYTLDKRPAVAALYRAVTIDRGLAYVSGALPADGGFALTCIGKVPSQVAVEAAKQAARLCAANLLRNLHVELGSLERIQQVIKITGYVNSDADFGEQHLVVNGASELLVAVLGEAGQHSRAAMGVSGLPLGAPVEIEMLARVVE